MGKIRHISEFLISLMLFFFIAATCVCVASEKQKPHPITKPIDVNSEKPSPKALQNTFNPPKLGRTAKTIPGWVEVDGNKNPKKEESLYIVIYGRAKINIPGWDNPEKSGKKITNVRKNTLLEILDQEERYFKVKTPSGVVCWVNKNWIDFDEKQAVALKEQAKKRKESQQLAQTQIIEDPAIDEIHFDPPKYGRTGIALPGWGNPEMDGKMITYVQQDSLLKILGEKGSFYKAIAPNGITCWVGKNQCNICVIFCSMN